MRAENKEEKKGFHINLSLPLPPRQESKANYAKVGMSLKFKAQNHIYFVPPSEPFIL